MTPDTGTVTDTPVVPTDASGNDAMGNDVQAADAMPGTDVQSIDGAMTDAPAPTDTPAPMDTPIAMDTPIVTDTPAPTDTPVPTDTPTGACGTGRPTITGITGTEGLVIAADGTIYYSQSGAVGRVRPGMPAQNRWTILGAGTGTVWGLAIDAPNHRLYAGVPGGTGLIYSIDLNAATPTATPLGFAAGGANGLTMGSDGFLYYSDFSGNNVYRVSSTGVRTRVTTSAISQANGVAFGPDGALYVDSYATGQVFRLVLTAGMESGRTVAAMGAGSPDGLAFDAMGRIYVSNNAGGQLYRYNADGTGRITLLTGISAAANIEFGAGALNCMDIYVASSGMLQRYTMGTTAGADVPWHH